MIALIFVIITTVLGIFIGGLMSSGDASWLDYYRGGVIGMLVSGLVLYVLNKRRRAKEIEEERKR
jgi:hypothetical protein